MLIEPLAERGLIAGEDIFVAFAPERIDPGVEGHEQLQTPRVIGAVSERCFRRAAELLRHTCRELHRVSSPEAAEMVKLQENTFRAVNIALAFELGEACRTFGLDPIEVTEAAATKPYGFMAHYPSAGIGGHCIGVDPYYLIHPLRQQGRPATLVEEAMRKVQGRPRHIVWRAHEELVAAGGRLGDARVLVVGASYKPGVADSREAPAREIIARLLEEGASVDYHDPLVPEITIGGRLMRTVDPDPRRDASGFGPEDYDLTIVVTVHPGHDYGWLNRSPRVLDCTYRNDSGRERLVP
jgi:nucleotide sugar dehydrogenase